MAIAIDETLFSYEANGVFRILGECLWVCASPIESRQAFDTCYQALVGPGGKEIWTES